MSESIQVRSRGGKGGHKYNKVNQQKKFHLLSLIYRGKMGIREAAEQVGINYLTAKTIVFFHKNHYKSYQFDLAPPHAATGALTATYVHPRKLSALTEKLIRPKSRIEVICSIGNVLSPPVGANRPPRNSLVEEKAYDYRPAETPQAASHPQNVIPLWLTMPKHASCPSINTNDLLGLASAIIGQERPAEDQPTSEERSINGAVPSLRAF